MSSEREAAGGSRIDGADDKLAITELLYRYAELIDRGDFDGVGALLSRAHPYHQRAVRLVHPVTSFAPINQGYKLRRHVSLKSIRGLSGLGPKDQTTAAKQRLKSACD